MTVDQKQPLYQKLKRQVITQIRERDLRPGDKLPSMRQMAEETGMSLAPIIRAIQELDAEGYIVRYQGKGSFVTGRLPAQNSSQHEIALVVPGIDQNEMFARMARQMQTHGRKLGCREIVLSADEYTDEADLVDEMTQTNVEGAIIFPPAVGPMAVALRKLQKRNFPFVLLNWSLPSIIGHRVTSDDFQAGYLLCKHLTDLGHKNIGLIVESPLFDKIDPRYHGHLQALLEAGITPDPSWLIYSNQVMHKPGVLMKSGQEMTRELLQRKPEMTALICNNPAVAAGSVKAIQQAGMKIPEDISVAMFSTAGDFLLSLDVPSVTAAEMHEEQVITLAMETLLDEISKGQTPPLHRQIPCELIEGATTAPPRNLIDDC